MYAEGTILKRDDPQGNSLDRLKVIGPSPIHHSAVGEWAGSGGDAIVVQPVDEFGPPENLPTEIAANLYSIESEPLAPPTHVVSAGGGDPLRAVRQLTAEEQFRLAAKQEPKTSARKRTPITNDQ